MLAALFLMAEHAARRGSALTIIFVTVFVDLLGLGIVLPLLPYYAQQFHASGATAGALIAVYSAMQFICAPLWGRWSDRIGRRPVMLISLAGSTCSYLLFALANGVGLLFLSRILAGVAGANIPVAQAFIADTTTEKDRARGMGLIGAAFGLGFVFGPAIGGLLAHYGQAAPGFAAAAICGLNLLSALWRLPESLPHAQRRPAAAIDFFGQLRTAFRQRRLRTLILLFGATVFSFSTVETTLSLLCAAAYHMSAPQIYWLFGYMGLMMTVMQGGLIGRLTPRLPEARLVFVGAALLTVGIVLTPFAPRLPLLLIALGAVAFGYGMTSPVLSSLISKAGGGGEHGGVLGLSQSAGSLARILGPLWGGVLFDLAGPAGPYLATAVLMLAATAAAFALPRQQAGSEASPPFELKASL